MQCNAMESRDIRDVAMAYRCRLPGRIAACPVPVPQAEEWGELGRPSRTGLTPLEARAMLQLSTFPHENSVQGWLWGPRSFW
jgi:hypothetical protein